MKRAKRATAGGAIWEAAIVPMGALVKEPGRPSFEPLVGMAVCTETGMIGVSEPRGPEEASPDMVSEAVESLQRTLRHWPAVVRVSDPALGLELERAGLPADGRVEVVRSLPTLEPLARHLAESMGGPQELPDALAVPGVKPEQLAGLAAAMGELLQAEPWRLLGGETPLRLSSPSLDPDVRVLIVTGALGDDPGLMCFPGESELEAFRDDPEEASESGSYWNLSMWKPDSFSAPERELLERAGVHDDEGRLPALVHFRKGAIRRASPRMLQLFEALLRALADIREEDLAAGRWHRRVATSMGPLDLTLECPEALEAARTRPGADGISPGLAIQRLQVLLDAIEPELESLSPGKARSSRLDAALRDPRGTLERAARPELDGRDLALLALSTEGPASQILARRALALHEALPNAHIALAMAAPDSEETLAHLGRAIETGEASLTEEARCLDGELGDHPLGLPLLRAHHDRGSVLLGLGRLEQASAAFVDLLALDRRDPLGARDRLTLVAIARGDLDEARRWLGNPRRGEAPGYLFNRSLLAFVEKGDTRIPQRYLDRAIKAYHSATLALLDEPYEAAEEPESEAAETKLEESLRYAIMARLVWEKVDGAMEWLQRRADAVLDELW